MAKKANQWISATSSIPVDAEKLTHRDRHKKYTCCGNIKGTDKICGIPMSLAIVNVDSKKNYFTMADKRRPHIVGCEYNERDFVKIISRLDQFGRDNSMERMLQTFNKPKVLVEKKEHGELDDTLGANGSGEQQDAKNLKRGKRNPNKIWELVTLLLTLDTDAPYCDGLVEDVLLSPKTRAKYCGEKIDDGTIMVVIGRKTNPSKAGLKTPPGCITLADYGSYPPDDQPVMYFFVSTEQKVIDQLLGKARDSAFGIIGRWHPVPGKPHTYVCDHIEESCVYTLPDDLKDYL